MGLGRFGGGEGVARWLIEHAAAPGAEIIVTDLKAPAADPALAEAAQRLERLAAARAGAAGPGRDGVRLTLRLGEHLEPDFTQVDLVIANPAVPRPWQNRYLLAAEAAAVPVTTEIRLLVECLQSGPDASAESPRRPRVIGVTGTAGKSTTVSMIHHILQRLEAGGVIDRRSHLGGNIGGSLLGTTIKDQDLVVLELSSGMLHWLAPGVGDRAWAGWAPDVAVITSFADNHVDWHGTLDHYRACKQRIVGAATRAVVLGPGLDCREWVGGIEGKVPAVLEVSAMPAEDLARLGGRLQVSGSHNAMNAAAAALACRSVLGAGVSIDAIADTLADFTGLPHRLELVASTADGRRFINDSKATTPEATLLALHAMGAPPSWRRVHLIVGGYDKEIDLAALAGLAPALAGMYTIGAVGPAIARQAAQACGGRAEAGLPPVHACGDLERAVAEALRRMRAGETLLLSPGCASWDQFPNFEVRGQRFAALVRAAIAREA